MTPQQELIVKADSVLAWLGMSFRGEKAMVDEGHLSELTGRCLELRDAVNRARRDEYETNGDSDTGDGWLNAALCRPDRSFGF